MKLEITDKAWYVWHDGMIGYGPEIYNSSDEVPVVYASNSGQAKTKAIEPYNWEIDGEDPKFTDLKCRRAKGFDKVIFEGNEIERHHLESNIANRHRVEKLNSFLKDPVLTHCYIVKRGTYYRPNSSGYTSQKHMAGIYTISEGVSKAISCHALQLVRTSKEDHNAMIEKTISEIRKLILN